MLDRWILKGKKSQQSQQTSHSMVRLRTDDSIPDKISQMNEVLENQIDKLKKLEESIPVDVKEKSKEQVLPLLNTNTEKKFVCVLCGERFSKGEELQEHMQQEVKAIGHQTIEDKLNHKNDEILENDSTSNDKSLKQKRSRVLRKETEELPVHDVIVLDDDCKDDNTTNADAAKEKREARPRREIIVIESDSDEPQKRQPNKSSSNTPAKRRKLIRNVDSDDSDEEPKIVEEPRQYSSDKNDKIEQFIHLCEEQSKRVWSVLCKWGEESKRNSTSPAADNNENTSEIANGMQSSEGSFHSERGTVLINEQRSSDCLPDGPVKLGPLWKRKYEPCSDDEDEDEDEDECEDEGNESSGSQNDCEVVSGSNQEESDGENAEKQSKDENKHPKYEDGDLLPHQFAGVNWLALMHRLHANAILADEMGLGKTIQIIAFLTLLREHGCGGPSLIIAPASVIYNWKREFNKWSPLRVGVLHGTMNEREAFRNKCMSEFRNPLAKANDQKRDLPILANGFPYNVILTTSAVLRNPYDRSFLKKLNLLYVIVDEAQCLKSTKSIFYRCLSILSADRKILLSGTPLQNNLKELLALLHFVLPISLDEKELLKRDDLTEKFKAILSPFLLRRLKSDVLKNRISKKFVSVKEIEMTKPQIEIYESILKSAKQNYLLKEKMNQSITPPISVDDDVIDTEESNEESTKEKITWKKGTFYIMQLRKAANSSLLFRTFYTNEKLKQIVVLLNEAGGNYVEEELLAKNDLNIHLLCKSKPYLSRFCLSREIILNSSGKLQESLKTLTEYKEKGKKIVFFSQMKQIIHLMCSLLDDEHIGWTKIDGETPISDRLNYIDQFNNDASITAMLLTTSAGGVGINLTAASAVLFFDVAFNPHVDEQAEDRCHRIGQTRDVTVVKLLSRDSVDKRIFELAQAKTKLHNVILEEGEEHDEKAMTAKKINLLVDELFCK